MYRKLVTSILAFILTSTALLFAGDVEVSGNITTNTTWTSNNAYLIKGFVYVKSGVTLTIQPGTVIYGDKDTKGALIIEQSAKLMAEGTAAQPIVFTSALPAGQRSYGDWGGIIICGKAPVNLPGGSGVIEGGVGTIFGGNDLNDNSGVLRYVRIEYPGIAFQPGNEINGLTLGGVGSATTIEHVQVSYSGDDGFEFFGGNVNAKYLISYRTLDDDFDTDNGYSGKIQFALVLRDPDAADQSGSNGFESDNDATGTPSTPKTSAVFSNFTVVGPKANKSDVANANYRRGAHLRRNTEMSLYNSIIMGWPTGILIDANATADNANTGKLEVRNTIVSGSDTVITNATNGFNALAWFGSAAFGNTRLANTADVQLVEAFNLYNPNFTPRAGSPALSGADFTSARLANAFFTPTSYRGAFGDQRWDLGWTNYNPQQTSSGDLIELSGNITANTTLTGNNKYLLKGFVYVKSGATLNIEAGTIIFGEKASKGSLIVEQGAKINANGSADRPIVFTSDQPTGQRTYGDWGGVIICGKAPVNLPGGSGVIEGGVGSTFGGTDPSDNSGVLRHVRIEYPGIAFQPGNEINGLTLGGVGNGTTIEYVQVSYSGDDSFEWFGGTVNCKYLIALAGLDDDFDTDNGYSGKVQFALSLRDPNAADQSGSNGFESDNDATGTPGTPKTSALFSNVTLVGPKANKSDVVNANYRRGLHLRRNTELSLYNSLIMGWPTGILIDANATADNATANKLQIRNTILASSDTVITNATNNFAALAWFETAGYGNNRVVTTSEVKLNNAFNLTNADFRPTVGSLALSGADFTNTRLTDTFFTATAYRGAFGGDTRWDAKWANYNPQYTVYSIISAVEVRYSETIPSSYLLEQNYPNPFNPSTNIKYGLPKSGRVLLKVYDMLGREVATLVNQAQPAGTYQVRFEATGMPTGLYFYRLSVGENVEVKRMLLVK